MDINKEMHKQINKIMKLKNFDTISFYYNFKRLVYNLDKFHNNIGSNAKNKHELSEIKYDIKGKTPKEGQVAYFFIENSYPKEIFNSHWCLVLKDLGNILVVIPLTSIKPNSKKVDPNRETIIKIKNFEEKGCSKLKINQIFSADLMRFDGSRKIYDLQTDFKYVKDKIKNILNLY